MNQLQLTLISHCSLSLHPGRERKIWDYLDPDQDGSWNIYLFISCAWGCNLRVWQLRGPTMIRLWLLTGWRFLASQIKQTQSPTCPSPDRIKHVKVLPINLSENKGRGLQNAPMPLKCKLLTLPLKLRWHFFSLRIVMGVERQPNPILRRAS